ncbi:MAG: LysM peptidoglycan-binding domain-containing protein [Ardenticatenaceae bacterium]|nr:LysM peptidoglycan-binding domain-containing protein [Ardenticatenaceae bacterium]MCB9444224.1 LysM peptidoglycan-binding domain-containing protein [Ardenticatenaceae bacterium]
MSEPKEQREKNIIDWTIKIEEPLATESYNLAEQNNQSPDEWVTINLYNAIASKKISDLRTAGLSAEYEPAPPFTDDETPPAFLIPYGPIPAFSRYHDTVPAETYQQQQDQSDDQPSVIELLPDSNPGGYWTHIVAPGETLSNIAARYYGNSALYPRIAQASNIYPPYIIYVGQVLTVPKPELSQPQVNSFTGGCTAWRSHVVQPGETLSNIAARYYGSSGDYWRIANCNNIYPPNYIIYVGDVLAIPARLV